jgi:hypothetical protein
VLPWEISDQYIRSGHRNPEEFEPNSLRTIVLSEKDGIKAVVGKPKGKNKMEVQSYLFDVSKGWTLEKAKAWFEEHHRNEAILSIRVLEKVVDKPLRIRGIAMTVGMSRNFNIYTPEELQVFTQKLVSAPVYVEHIAVPNAVGKIVKAEWDGKNLWYEAEIYDDEVAEKIRKGLIKHVSVGADYETIDVIDGKIPHGLHNAELSLVAVPGISETNIKIMEKLQLKEQNFEPIIAGEYILGFSQDASAFLPEHFSTVWLDKENGILARALHSLGFNPTMLGSLSYNLQKIHATGKSKIVKILEELSRKEGALRKRLLSLHGVYPRHQEFVEKMRGLDEVGLAKALKRLSFLAQTKVYLFWSKI